MDPANPGRINSQCGAFCDTPLIQLRGSDERTSRICSSRQGANVEARNELDERPLHASATYGHPTVAKLLLARGADVNARGQGGKRRCTPRRAASASRRTSKHASSREAAPCGRRRCDAREPGSGCPPLRCATSWESRNTAMANLLLSHGADRGAPNSRHRRFAAFGANLDEIYRSLSSARIWCSSYRVPATAEGGHAPIRCTLRESA